MDTYYDQRATTVGGGIVGSYHSEGRFPDGGHVERHSYKVTNNKHLKYPRENGEEQRAHEMPNGPDR